MIELERQKQKNESIANTQVNKKDAYSQENQEKTEVRPFNAYSLESELFESVEEEERFARNQSVSQDSNSLFASVIAPDNAKTELNPDEIEEIILEIDQKIVTEAKPQDPKKNEKEEIQVRIPDHLFIGENAYKLNLEESIHDYNKNMMEFVSNIKTTGHGTQAGLKTTQQSKIIVMKFSEDSGMFEVTFWQGIDGQKKEQRVIIEYSKLQLLHQMISEHFFYKVLPFLDSEKRLFSQFLNQGIHDKRAEEIQLYLNKLIVNDEIKSFHPFVCFLENMPKFEELADEFCFKRATTKESYLEMLKKKCVSLVQGLFQNHSDAGVFEELKKEFFYMCRFLKNKLTQLKGLHALAVEKSAIKSEISTVLLKIQERFSNQPQISENSVVKITTREEMILIRQYLLEKFIRVVKNVCQDTLAFGEAFKRADLVMEKWDIMKKNYESELKSTNGKANEMMEMDIREHELKVQKINTLLKLDLEIHIVGIKNQIKEIFGEQFVILMKELSYLI